MPSNHVFQPRAEEVRKLQEKFDSLEMTNPGDVVMTVYITGDPASGKTQLAGQFGREFFEKNKHKKKKLFVGTLHECWQPIWLSAQISSGSSPS